MLHGSDLFLSIGKQVKNEYGYELGEVVSLIVKPNGAVECVYVKQNDGKLVKYSAESLRVEGSKVTFLSKVRTETETLCNLIPLIWRKDQALKELLEKKRALPEVCNDLHSAFDGALKQLIDEAQALMRKIDGEIVRCAQEIKELNYALVHLEIEREIGKIDDKSYTKAFSTIQECLKRANAEKSDLEAMRSKLSNILLGEAEQGFKEIHLTQSGLETPSPICAGEAAS